ncbi:hypothetical protein BD310DRAFT_890234 [Dichomitus squalens]|uniref:Uncharacterized protein n=1 Tax=Dichomitus squalens TaxID=114155 RepID=A0A4Q9PG10_9APHY|nr:hypothetical protein BD310DRAFT_890234 [Dichomitus squalens]
MSSNTYAPPGESASDLWLEKSNFDGAVLGGVAYGVHVAVFAVCARTLYRSTKIRRTRRHAVLVPLFISLLFAMGTVNLACNTRMTQLMFIDNRAFPGGPNAWFFAFYSLGTNTAGNASYVVANALADGVLLWRVYAVYNSIWAVLFPLLVYLASTAMSILSVFQSSRPTASLWTSTTVQFTVPYFSISIGLNILLTLLLVGRLLYFGYNTRRAIGSDHLAPYVSIATMLIESAAPYAITGLIFIVTYARNSNVQNLILPVLSQVMCISPELIILRVATGSAVSTKISTTQPVTSMRFGPKEVDVEQSFALTSLGTSATSRYSVLWMHPYRCSTAGWMHPYHGTRMHPNGTQMHPIVEGCISCGERMHDGCI